MQYARGPLPLRELMARLSRAEQQQAWAEIERALAQFVGPQGYDSPCELLIGVGRNKHCREGVCLVFVDAVSS